MKRKTVRAAAMMLSIILALSACSVGTGTSSNDEYAIPDYGDACGINRSGQRTR